MLQLFETPNIPHTQVSTQYLINMIFVSITTKCWLPGNEEPVLPARGASDAGLDRGAHEDGMRVRDAAQRGGQVSRGQDGELLSERDLQVPIPGMLFEII